MEIINNYDKSTIKSTITINNDIKSDVNFNVINYFNYYLL